MSTLNANLKLKICSRSSLSQLYYFNFILRYKTPISVNPTRVVKTFHGCFSRKKFRNLGYIVKEICKKLL
jgi:hypothetical protein